MKKNDNSEKAVYGITWLTREEWQKMRAIAADPDTLSSSYEDWMMMVWRIAKDLEQEGNRVKKIPVDTGIFAEWCGHNNRLPNNAARSEYVSYVMATERAFRQSKKRMKGGDE
ncbi:hypothetical protein MASR2M18_06130 [Ignavibacteria bacterium]|jgi:hypothetical protein|nr:hypothetical protein [Bacteroidota bacterium]MCZ2133754.1 hypothetical protein [Bacteroidota bacterium]